MKRIVGPIICGTMSCLLTACTSATPETNSPVTEEKDSIVGGKKDTGDPSVVALYGQAPNSEGGSLCTASVIAPTVVLTAAHCVSPLETGPGAQFVVITGPDVYDASAKQLAVRSVHANPLWNPNKLQAGHDQGIVILSERTSLRPLPFNRHALSNADLGSPLRIVGYGLDDGVEQTGAGLKRQALTTLRSVSATLLGLGDSRRGTCNGDSGGPAFMNVGGVETIVGVTSYGNSQCTDGGYDARVDTDLAFIEQYLADACLPACDGRSCGSDGCGGTCGTCDTSQMCDGDGQCLKPTGGCTAGGGEEEPNDSALQANPLCAGNKRQGTLSSSGDQDWFTWTVSADSVYTVTIAAESSAPAVRVYKLSATGKLSFIGDGPTVARHTEDGGTYVARINTVTEGVTAATYSLAVTITQ